MDETLNQALSAWQEGRLLEPHIDKMIEEGHPFAPVFSRLHTLKDKNVPGDFVWERRRGLNGGGVAIPTTASLGYLHDADEDTSSDKVRVFPAISMRYRNRPSVTVPLRREEWKKLHEYLHGNAIGPSESEFHLNDEPETPVHMSRPEPNWENFLGRSHDLIARFHVGGGAHEYSVNAIRHKSGKWALMFEKLNSEGLGMDLTGTGHAKEVFSHIISHVHDLIHNRGAKHISFTADNSEPSRVKLYKYLTAKVHKIHPDFTGHVEESEGRYGSTRFHLKHKDVEEPEQLSRWEYGRPGSGRFTAAFETPAGKYRASMSRKNGWLPGGLPIHEFQFGLSDKEHPDELHMDVMHTGHAKEVISQVISLAHEFLHQHQPPVMRFTSEGNAHSRGKLYKWLASRVHKIHPDYKGYHIPAQHEQDVDEFFAVHKDHQKDFEEGFRRHQEEFRPQQLARWSKETGRPGEGRTASFKTSRGQKYSAQIFRKAPGHDAISFRLDSPDAKSPFGITGVGGAKEVFGEVIKLVHQHLHETTPQRLSFAAPHSEPSRVKLYDYLASKVSKIHPEYKGEVVQHPTHTEYHLVHQGPAQLARGERNFLHEAFPISDTPVKFDPELSRRTAVAFEKARHQPTHPFVAKSYGAFKQELLQQYEKLKGLGIKFEPWTQPGQPYANSKEMRADVLQNRTIKFFTGGDMAADHPLSEKHGSFSYNDILRAVHDVLGHAMNGHQFGPKGELQAWGDHARMFSPLARHALTAETHGQNSWVNFGPHGDRPVTERPYAEQKATVLPKSATPPVPLARDWEDNHEHGLKDATFEVGNFPTKRRYAATLTGGPTLYSFEFGIGDRGAALKTGMTGTGYAKEVMGHAVRLVHSALHNLGIPIITFSADHSHPSRAKLYERLTGSVRKIHSDYRPFKEVKGSSTDYYLVHKDHLSSLKKIVENPEQLARLHHFSDRLSDDVVIVDPEAATKKRHKYSRAEFRESGYPRTFWYLDPKQKEGIVFGTHYVADVPDEKLYDLHADEEGHVKSASGKGVSWLFEQLEKAGYHGARYTTGGRDIATTWVPVEARKAVEERPESLARRSEPLFTADQQALLNAVQGPHDSTQIGILRDKLQEDNHPLWQFFARAPEWHKRNPPARGLESLTISGSPSNSSKHGPARSFNFAYNGGSTRWRSGHLYDPVTSKLLPGAQLDIGGHFFHAPMTHEELKRAGGLFTNLGPISGEDPPVDPKSVVEPEQLARGNVVQDSLSDQGRERRKLLARLLVEAKLRPISLGTSYAMGTSGLDAGSYAEVIHNNEPDAVSYVGHYYGLLNGSASPDLHVFHEGQGNHKLTIFDTPLQTDKLYEAIGSALSSPMLRVIPKDGFSRVAVVNNPDSGILKRAGATNVQQFNGEFATLRHRSSPGASAGARETHRNAIRDYERQQDNSGPL